MMLKHHSKYSLIVISLLIILILIFLPLNSSASVVYYDSWATELTPVGITHNDTRFFVAGFNDKEVYLYYRDGTYTGSHFDTSVSGNDVLKGVVTDDNFIWTTDSDDKDVYKYYMNGTYTGSHFDTSSSGNTNPLGLTMNASYFWILDGTTEHVYQYQLNGLYVDSWDTERTGVVGIYFNDVDSTFWITDSITDSVHQYYLNGTQTGDFFSVGNSGNNNPFGITMNSTYLWITDSNDNKVYQYYNNSIPSIPTLVFPNNNSIQKSSTVLLNVSSTDPNSDIITYYFYGGTSPDSMSFLGTNDSVGSSTYNWTLSQYNVYYWTCFVSDGYENSTNMTTAQFTLITSPNLTSPSNTSTEYATFPPLTDSITFTWQDLSVAQYRLMVAEDNGFNIMSVDSHIATNSSVHTLLVNKEYFWKVYSYDGTTYSNSSEVFRFNLTGNSTLTGSAIEGVVYQSNGDINAISGAEVTIWNTTWSDSMITGSNGYYVFEDLESGTVYNLQAKSDRYWDSSIALVSAEDNPVTSNFYLIDDLTDTEWWHYVEFTLQNVWGVTYPDVSTNVYIGDSPTISESGNTESDGTISFHLNQNVQYHITFINSTLGINEDITLYPVATSYTVYIDSYSFDLPDTVTDDIQAYIVSSRINSTYGYINFTWLDTSGLTTSINYYISDVDGNELYNTSTSNPDLFDSQIVTATDDRYIVRYIGVHPTHGIIDKTETIVFHGGRRVDLGWDSDWQYAVTALAFLIFTGALFGAKTAHYGAITVVIFAFIFKWIGWLNETNTSTLLIILAAVIAFGWSLRKSEEVKM